MADLKPFEETLLLACRSCLDTDCFLHDLNKIGLCQTFGELTGLSMYPADGYPQYVCSMCLFLLRKFSKFRMRCHTAMWTLQQMRMNVHTITTDLIKRTDTTHIKQNFNRNDLFNINVYDENDDRTAIVRQINEKINQILSDDEPVTQNPKQKRKVVKRKHKVVEQKKEETEPVKKIEEVRIEKVQWEVSIKQEDVDDQDQEDVKVEFESEDVTDVKSDHSDKDFSPDASSSSDDEDLASYIKKEDAKGTKRKPAKRKTVRITKPKVERKKRPRKARFGDDDVEINDDWRKIVEEIKEEIIENKVTKRKIPALADMQYQTKQARKFASSYNVDVKFLTKEEQKMEIEEKRNSDKFEKAPFKCEECCKVFVSLETFVSHAIVHNPNSGEYICEICRYRFPTRLQFMKHFNGQHTKKISCKECGLISRGWNQAKEHYLWHQGQHQNITCEQCDMQFTLRKNYLMHVRNKHGGSANGPVCLLCDRTFINQKGIQIHTDRSHKNKARCSSCGVAFAGSETLAVHLNAPLGCQPGHSSCPKCGLNFINEGEMMKHYDDDHRKNYYKCETCERSFVDQDKYTSHLKYHNWRHYRDTLQGKDTSRNGHCKKGPKGEKRRFVCEVCGREKTCLALLRAHQRIHTGEKPYECNICHKAFNQKPALKIHITTHTDERRFKCPMCPKAFRQYSHRGSHLLTHTKQRPFACGACPKRYTSQSALKDHTNTAHLGLPPRKWGRKKDLE